MTDETYKGWTNYETWLVALWIENENGVQLEAMNLAGSADDAYELSRNLKEWIEDIDSLEKFGLYRDLIDAALPDVNWLEIAEYQLMRSLKLTRARLGNRNQTHSLRSCHKDEQAGQVSPVVSTPARAV